MIATRRAAVSSRIKYALLFLPRTSCTPTVSAAADRSDAIPSWPISRLEDVSHSIETRDASGSSALDAGSGICCRSKNAGRHSKRRSGSPLLPRVVWRAADRSRPYGRRAGIAPRHRRARLRHRELAIRAQVAATSLSPLVDRWRIDGTRGRSGHSRWSDQRVTRLWHLRRAVRGSLVGNSLA